ncbi:MAG: class I SAM-dependent methyltransferase [Planctomycetota bacterium]
MATPPIPSRPDYGLDAPGVVRNLALVAVVGLLLAAGIFVGFLPRVLHIPVGANSFDLELLGITLGPGLPCGVVAFAMWWGSRFGKLRARDQLLDAAPWRGDEVVLDVGCGAGLMLVGAAKRLRTGQAIGVDLWRSEDLAGNRPEAALANAQAEGVAERVRIETADMRQLPLADASVDRVVSRAAIHNLADAEGRAQAIREIARVLRPGGLAVVDDIRHIGDYLATFRAAGCTPVRRLDSAVASFAWTLMSFGAMRSGAWLVRKGA